MNLRLVQSLIFHLWTVLIILPCLLVSSSSQSDNDGRLEGDTFDFIIVGSGVGGSTVAARLAESGQFSVLMIEAGGMPHPDLDIPALSENHLTDPESVKIYQTVPQRNAGLAQNGIMNITQGRVLGGSSAVNGMLLNRGSPFDYENWAELTGDTSWSYSGMLPYLKRYENYTGLHNRDQRGFSGPITVSNQKYTPGLSEWLEGGKELGYIVTEPNGPQLVSFTGLDYTRKRGRRVTSYSAYIQPILNTKCNLHVRINSEVDRILFEGNRAVGVTFTTRSNQTGSYRARKEVIVSAGAIDTPVLLLRSGIGPKSVLDAWKIPTVSHLPVGLNLQDHPFVPLVVVLSNGSAVFDPDRDLNPSAWQEFLETGDGPYTNKSGTVTQAFSGSSLLPENEKGSWADIHLIPLFANLPRAMERVADLREGEVAISIYCAVARPRSRGSVTLEPEGIHKPPLIDFQYFTDPYDMQVMVEAIKASAKICENTQAFRNLGCRIPAYRLPSCEHLQFRSDSYWECYASHLTQSGLHMAGTCRMGRGIGDPKAVVDTKLRVIGIEGLRIVDASIMPTLPNANTQSPVYAIGEKAAELILQ